MAKGKSAAALFEVIHGGNRNQSAESKMDTPKWWFKSRKRDFITASAPIEVASPVATMDHGAPSDTTGRGAGIGLGRLKLIVPSSHTVALGLMLTAVFGVGFVVGQRFDPSGLPVLSEQTTDELIAGTANPEVLDIASEPSAALVQRPELASSTAGLYPSRVNAAPTPDGTLPATTSVIDGSQRTIGLNYVIVQSYPEEADALKAVQILAEHRISTTVVKGPPGWAQATWYSVVGTKGFPRIRGVAEFDRYVESINKVSAKFAGRSKFKEFTPRAYKWKTAEPTVTAAQ